MIPRTASRPRVVESHRLVRFSFLAAGGFALVGLVWMSINLTRGGTWWGPLHAFLVGTVLSAISGTTQMFTTTWSASPPPPRWMSIAQGSCLVGGASLVLVGVGSGYASPTWIGGGLVICSLLMLGAILVRSIRSSLLRRFDLSARFYLLAIACGAVGVSLGVALGTGIVDASTYLSFRAVHLHLNLVGLVGFTILGTIPTLLPTFAHQKMVSGTEAVVAWWMCLGGSLLITLGLVDPIIVGAGVLLVASAASLIVGGILTRLEPRESRETLPLFHVTMGLAWLIVWLFVDGTLLVTSSSIVAFSGWTMAAVTAGVGQILLGSMAYIIPVVVGAPIGDNLRTMGGLPVIPLTTANLTGVLLVLGQPRPALVAGVVWLLDFVRRLVSLRKPTRSAAT